MRAKNILYVPSTDPRWVWYDDRATPTEYLRETMAARKIMLAQYGPAILQAGEPIGALRDMRLWMTYLHHRWAIEAGLGYVGGMYHNIVVKGETLPPTEIVPAALQREVLGLLMEAIEPANLAIPETLLAQLTPSPGANLEDLAEDYAFDHLRAGPHPVGHGARAAARAGARGAARGVCRSPARRAVAAGGRGRDAGAHVARGAATPTPRHRSLRRVTERVALDAMMILGGHAETSPEARAYVLDQIAQAGRVAADAQGRQPAHRRALPPGGARHRALSRESGGQRAEECDAALGRPSAVAVSAASGAAARLVSENRGHASPLAEPAHLRHDRAACGRWDDGVGGNVLVLERTVPA